MADATLKKIRKGTRSCTECRLRKTRCIFTNPSDSVCQFCRERGRTCVPQTHTRGQRSGAASRDALSNDRLHRLEEQLARISARVGRHNSQDDQASDAETESSEGEDDDSRDRNTDSLSRHDWPGVHASDTPPTHLKVLFDNALISVSNQNNCSSLPNASFNDPADGLRSSSSKFIAQARRRLQRLLPSLSAVRNIFSRTSTSAWTGLFPQLSIMREPQEMIENYDDYLRTTAEPIPLAVFVLTVAMMTRQLPLSDLPGVLEGVSDASHYAATVARTVRETVVAHNEIVPTLDGLEMAIAFNRLQVARGEIRDVWLNIRKLVALAELIGLPRVTTLYAQRHQNASAKSATSTPVDSQEARKVEIFAAMCAADRLQSMMFNLPSATGHFRIPARPIINESDGSVDVHAYAFSSSSIAVRVQEIDEDFTSGQPHAEIYNRVILADYELRSLAAKAPKRWWNPTSDEKTYIPDVNVLLVQFLHCYQTVRVHLHFALKDDYNEGAEVDNNAFANNGHISHNSSPYAYSRSACIEACKAVARRYPALRAMIPNGFFLARLVHIQVFTVTTVLLLTRHQNLRNAARSGMRAIDPAEAQEMHDYALQMLTALEDEATKPGSEFAREESVALRALYALLEDPTAAPAERLALQIPMLGKVHIGRRPQRQAPVVEQQVPTTTAYYPHEQMQTAPMQGQPTMISQYIPAVPVGQQIQQDDLSWLLELDMNAGMQNPFLAATGADLDGWMDWSSSNANSIYPDMPS